MFNLDPILERDTYLVGEFNLSLVLLHKDANYPWCILVPKLEGVTEVFQMTREQQIQLLDESSRLAEFMSVTFAADKLNVAALGNVVSQLHVHHIVRYKSDDAWPKPIWGLLREKAYSVELRESVLRRLRSGLDGLSYDC